MLENKTPLSIGSNMPKKTEVTLYTDAGVREGKASIACIISIGNQPKKKFAALIDFTTSTEAEAEALIFGLIILRSILVKSTSAKVNWHTDCSTLLRRSESRPIQPAKHKSFKDILLENNHPLFSNFEISPIFIKAHSGEKENELCDKVCKWLCTDTERIMKKYGEGLVGRLAIIEPKKAWLLFDLRGMTNSFDLFYKILISKLSSSIKTHVQS